PRDDAGTDPPGGRPDGRDVEEPAVARLAVRATRARAAGGRLGRTAGAAEELLDARRLGIARRAELLPGAVAGILVVAPAHELRAVAKARPLHLVVAHLDDLLWTHGGLL